MSAKQHVVRVEDEIIVEQESVVFSVWTKRDGETDRQWQFEAGIDQLEKLIATLTKALTKVTSRD